MAKTQDFSRSIRYLNEFQKDARTSFSSIFRFKKNKLHSEDIFAGAMGALLSVFQEMSNSPFVRFLVYCGLADGNSNRAEFMQTAQVEALAYALANGTYNEIAPNLQVTDNSAKKTKKDLDRSSLTYTFYELNFHEQAFQEVRLQAFGFGVETNGPGMEETAKIIAKSKAHASVFGAPVNLETSMAVIQNTAEHVIANSTINFSDRLSSAVLHMGFLNLGFSLGSNNLGPGSTFTGSEGSVARWGRG